MAHRAVIGCVILGISIKRRNHAPPPHPTPPLSMILALLPRFSSCFLYFVLLANISSMSLSFLSPPDPSPFSAPHTAVILPLLSRVPVTRPHSNSYLLTSIIPSSPFLFLFLTLVFFPFSANSISTFFPKFPHATLNSPVCNLCSGTVKATTMIAQHEEQQK